MILRRLRVENFGCLGSGQWEFGRGINLVRGPNEAGKSTLAEAIAKALLGQRPASTAAEDYERWRTWGREEMFVLEAEFEHGGRRWRVVRDYAEGRETLECLDDGRRLRGGVRERLAEMVGLQPRHSEQQYLATAYMKQGEWARLEEAAGLEEIIARVVLAGGTGGEPLKVLRELADRRTAWMRGVKKEAPKNPGPIAQALKRLREIDEQLQGADGLKRRAEQEEKARHDLLEARRRLGEIRGLLRQLKPRLERAEKRLELERRRKDLEQQAEELAREIARAEELARQAAEARRQLQELPQLRPEDVAALREQARQVGKLRREADEAEAAAREHEQAAERLREKAAAGGAVPDDEEVRRALRAEARLRELEEQARRLEEAIRAARSASATRRRLGLAIVAAGLLLLTVGGFVTAPLWLRAALAVAGVVCLALGAAAAWRAGRQPPGGDRLEELEEELREAEDELRAILGRWGCETAAELAQRRAATVERRAETERKIAGHETAAAQLREQAEEARRQAGALASAVAEKLTAWGVADLKEAGEKAARRREAEKALGEAEAALEQVLKGRGLEDMRAELASRKADITAVETALGEPEMMAAKMTEQQFGELHQRVRELEEQEREMMRQEAEADGILSGLAGSAAELVAAMAEREAVQKQLEHAERYGRVLETAVELLDEAIAQVRASADEVILPKAAELLARLTVGRYRKVEFGPGTAMVEAPELGEPVEVDEVLSYATREQVYLALRLAMYLTLWPQDGPPLIMDEPLLAFDAERTRAALDVIKQISDGRQVIILSATDEYDAIADVTIELEGKAAGGDERR